MNKTIDNLKKLKSFHNGSYGADIDKAIKALEFAVWLAEEIFSDDWECNKDSFEVLACRKLDKLNIVKNIDGYWVLAGSEKVKVGTKKMKEIVIRVTENFYQKIMEMDADKTASFNETALVEAVQKGEVLNKDATRKKGKWTPGDPICPCCGEDKFKDLDADIWSDWRPKYCPNCGAKMESESKE